MSEFKKRRQEFKERGLVVTVYHGTTIEEAAQMVKGGIDTSRGHGEFGLGFYTVFSAAQARHIARYYWDKQEKHESGDTSGTAVLVIKISLQDWQDLITDSTTVCYDYIPDYFPRVLLPDTLEKWNRQLFAQDETGRRTDLKRALTIGPIKDNQTPYLQAVFGKRAMSILNKAGVRSVLEDTVSSEAFGKDAYEKDSALSDLASFKASLPMPDKVKNFVAGASEATDRMGFVTNIFGSIEKDALPDEESPEGQTLKSFLTKNGVKANTSSDEASELELLMIAYINKGFVQE